MRSIFLIAATGFWITMTSLLIQREYFSLAPIQSSYEVLPLHNPELRTEYRALYMGGERVGFSYIVLDKLDKDTMELRYQTYFSFLFLGREKEMLVRGSAKTDSFLHLQEFETKISSGGYWTKMTGRMAKDNLDLVIEGKSSEAYRKILPVKQPLYFSESLAFMWTPENLKAGKTGKLEVWNPLAMNFQAVHFKVKGKTVLNDDGEDREVYEVSTEFEGIESRAWVTPEGIILKEESPTGLTIRKEDGWKIFDAMHENRKAPPDLANLYSIASNEILKHPARLGYLKAKITSPSGETMLEIQKDKPSDLKDTKLPVAAETPELAEALKATPWVQSDDPVILETAKRAGGNETSALEASKKLMDFVHKTIAPLPTLSIPRAREVLAIREGDCNEYTVLFTALARALGIPARMVAGLVYQNGRFFYHAWSEIYLGRWVGIDPTFGQFPIDVTHLPLVRGELEEQIALVNKLGKTQVAILETKEENP